MVQLEANERMILNLLQKGKKRGRTRRFQKNEARQIARRQRPLLKLGFPEDFTIQMYNIRLYRSLAKYKKSFLRPLSSFNFKKYKNDNKWYDPYGKLSIELLKHLFASYPIPSCMQYPEWGQVDIYLKMFIHLGKGHNVRTFKWLPFRLTKKMAHTFLTGKSNFGLIKHLRWSQVQGIGDRPELAQHIAESFLGDARVLNTSEQEEEFWQQVITWLANEPEFTREELLVVLTYVQHLKFNRQKILQSNGSYRSFPPPKPNMKMKGRKFQKLLKEAYAWLDQLSRTSSFKNNKLFRKIKGFEVNHGDGKLYSIIPLLNEQALVEEGKIMSHCVGTYIEECEQGISSIWSLSIRFDENEAPKKLLTLEVDESMAILQARGFANRLPSQEERAVLAEWMTAEGLTYEEAENED